MLKVIHEAHPVFHDGIYFRSKLEARWWSFFQSMGSQPVYEPETFSLWNNGREVLYQPDFSLPFRSGDEWYTSYVEVKARAPSDAERLKLELLVKSRSDGEGYMLWGPPSSYVMMQTCPSCGKLHVPTRMFLADGFALYFTRPDNNLEEPIKQLARAEELFRGDPPTEVPGETERGRLNKLAQTHHPQSEIHPEQQPDPQSEPEPLRMVERILNDLATIHDVIDQSSNDDGFARLSQADIALLADMDVGLVALYMKILRMNGVVVRVMAKPKPGYRLIGPAPAESLYHMGLSSMSKVIDNNKRKA